MRRQPRESVADQIESAYRRMADRAQFRPAAPSDGFGNITVPLEELSLNAEAAKYAKWWWAEEEDQRYELGCCHFPYRPAAIYATEAVRSLNGVNKDLAVQLLKMAIASLDDEE